VAELADDYFEIAVIPKTWELTNLSHLRENDEVNLEADIIAKYVERILTVKNDTKGEQPSRLTIEKLTELGYK
jgi:riboflavin synthase